MDIRKMPNNHPHRNAVIGKIHIAKKEMAVEDGSYRALLLRVTGKDSTKTMSQPELEAVVEEFKRLGFKPKNPRKAGARKMADNPQARMIRAIWLDLRDMNALTDSSERALAKFCERTCGKSDLHFLSPKDANQVINALRGWLERIEKKNAY